MLPTGLDNSWDVSLESKFPQTQTAHTELSVKAPGPAANWTSVVFSYFKSLGFIGFYN
jgi:hypothetical protein